MSFSELAEITANGWTQGSFLGADAARDLGLDGDSIDGWLVASHPCDIVARSLDNEPFVDVVPVRLIDALNGTYAFGANPRKLHVAVVERAYEADLIGRRTLRRELLGNVTPAGNLDKRSARTFAQWLGSRYSRPFFPDAFNDRRQPSSKRVNAILKRRGSSFSGVYIDVADAELGDDEVYVVTLLFTILPEVVADTSAWADANEAADEIVALWNDEKGINVDKHFVESEDDVPISMLRTYTRLDFDSYTIRGDEAGDQPLSISI
ncbi:hypothetical protein AUQ48_17060 [Kocuria flava]|uniref:Uncharacterized protein n=1 Tax=Kocuria flava TaxID=446860 RepID=A0A2N4SXQ7_9MICC|nr:hypothetical protein [Kocuria flava]PLC10760.1 hypothetical protein AUQ48_17060 [Kocuria flava]